MSTTKVIPKKANALARPAQTFSEKHLRAVLDTWHWGKWCQCSGVSGLTWKKVVVVVIVVFDVAVAVIVVVVIIVEKERKKGRKTVVCSCWSCKWVAIIFAVICWSGMLRH